MEITRRTLLQLAGLGAIGVGTAGALAGCAGVLPEADVTRAGFGENASGTVSVWSRSATQAGMQRIVDAFNKKQSRIRVELTPVLDGQYVTKLATAIRGGDVPDLVDIDDINSQLFIFRDAFNDLTPQVKALPYFDKLSPGHLNLAKHDGRYFGVPFLADNSVLWCNTRLFEKARLDIDAATTSFDTLLDAAGRISALGDDIHGWSFSGNSSGILGFTVQPHIWATGTDLIKGTIGSQTGNVEGNDAVHATLSFFRQLWTKKYVAQTAYSDDGSHWGSDFLSGNIGIFPSSYGAVVPAGKASFLKDVQVVIIPGPSGGRCFFDGGDNLCMPRGAKNPSAAWEFVKFALDAQQQKDIPAGGYTPIRSDVDTASFRTTYPLATQPLSHLSDGYAPTTLGYNLIHNQPDGPWLSMFRDAVFGGDIDAAMANAQTGYDRILKAVQS